MTVLVSFHIVIGQRFNARGWADGKPSVRVAKGRPDVAGHEVTLAMDLELPDSLFKKPALSAKVVVPDNAAPFDVSAQLQENIARAVKDQLGIVLHVSAPADD